MSDHDLCPKCKYENARCACPKKARRLPAGTKDERRALVESIKEAIREKRREA